MADLGLLESFVAEISTPAVTHQLLSREPVVLEHLYCNHCRAKRRVAVTHLYTEPAVHQIQRIPAGARSSDPTKTIKNYTPSAHMLSCVQCSEQCLAVIFKGPDGARLALLRSNAGGISTPNTPPGVAYYLDQAARAESVGAYSAALVMYRSALEHLLHHLGFTKGMLSQKIEDLKQKRAEADAPRWVRDLDIEDLSVLGKLGNGAVHTNGGDITKQNAIDHALVMAVTLTFSHILDDAIERVKKDEDRKALLKAAASTLR